MPNWCSNYVEVLEFFDDRLHDAFMVWLWRSEEDEREIGLLPMPTTEEDPENGYKVPDSWMFDIQLFDSFEAGCAFQYETKWAPNIKTMLEIAKRFKFSFQLDYEEGTSLYGSYRFFYDSKNLYHKDLTHGEIANIDYVSESYAEDAEDMLADKNYKPINIDAV